VSSLGVTGVRSDFHEGIDRFLATVRRASSVPICVGFGISSREQAERFAGIADGVIVGSAIVRQVEASLPPSVLGDEAKTAAGLAEVKAFIAALKPRKADG